MLDSVPAMGAASGPPTEDMPDLGPPPQRLTIDVETPASVPLGEVEDRVGALDGRLEVDETRDGGMTVRVEVACA